jgi:hypothetical protein
MPPSEAVCPNLASQEAVLPLRVDFDRKGLNKKSLVFSK